MGVHGRTPENTGSADTLTPQEFLGRLREFPEEARGLSSAGNAVILSGTLSDYGLLNAGPPDLPYPSQELEYLLEDIGRDKAEIDTLLNTYRGDGRREVEPIVDHLQYASAELGRVAELVSIYPDRVERVRSEAFGLSAYRPGDTTNLWPATWQDQCPIAQGAPKRLVNCLFVSLPTIDEPLGPKGESTVTCVVDVGRYSGSNRVYEHPTFIRFASPPCVGFNGFASAPTIVATAVGGDVGYRDTFAVTIIDLTPDGFRFYVRRVDGNDNGNRNWGQGLTVAVVAVPVQ